MNFNFFSRKLCEKMKEIERQKKEGVLLLLLLLLAGWNCLNVLSLVWTTSSPYLFTVIPFTIHNTHWQTDENNNIKRPQIQKWIFHACPFEPRHGYIHTRTHTHILVQTRTRTHFNSQLLKRVRFLSSFRFENFRPYSLPKKKRKLCIQHYTRPAEFGGICAIHGHFSMAMVTSNESSRIHNPYKDLQVSSIYLIVCCSGLKTQTLTLTQ